MLDSHILTNLLRDFANIFSAGVGNIMGLPSVALAEEGRT